MWGWPAGLLCCRSRLRRDCPVLLAARWGRRTRYAASPLRSNNCGQSVHEARCARPLRRCAARRQQGAPPATPTSLFRPAGGMRAGGDVQRVAKGRRARRARLDAPAGLNHQGNGMLVNCELRAGPPKSKDSILCMRRAGHQRAEPPSGRAPCWRRAAQRRGGHVRSACFVHLTCRPCLNGAPAGGAVSWAAPPRREQRRAVPLKAGPPTLKPGRMAAQTPPRAVIEAPGPRTPGGIQPGNKGKTQSRASPEREITRSLNIEKIKDKGIANPSSAYY